MGKLIVLATVLATLGCVRDPITLGTDATSAPTPDGAVDAADGDGATPSVPDAQSQDAAPAAPPDARLDVAALPVDAMPIPDADMPMPTCGPDSAPECTALIGCREVGGRTVFVVDENSGLNGIDTCRQHGMVCVDEDNSTVAGPCSGDACLGLPIFDPREAACLAFHPGAAVTSDVNGWAQAVFCSGDQGQACMRDGCHSCLACFKDALNCGTNPSTRDELSEVFVTCEPTPCD